MANQLTPFCSKIKTITFLFFTSCFLSLLLVFTPRITAQRPVYKITAKLDTFSTPTIKGTIDISWTNNSNQTLEKLGIHLWPNAYSNKNTALAKQFLEQGDVTMFKAPPSDLGGLKNLDFTSSGMKINVIVDSNNIDIAWLELIEPLKPGATITISSPYTLIVPKSFSRIGRTGNSYQLTQWYPHVAVYDEKGWHMMPYLNQGEYYNDFADYEVNIQVPPGYKIAATGVLESTIQKDGFAEWTFKADNVIDFAWFASPTFRFETLQVDVGGEKPVELKLYIDSWLNESWGSAVLYAERALKFYSDWLGPYPYPQMSVVYTPFSKAGYMEYPMVAEISYTEDPVFLDRVIAHEMGHTWLYGILASDERTYPWLDEGFNSFMEDQYMKTYYKHPVETYLPKILRGKNSMDDYDALQHITRFSGDMQPPMTPPEHQKSDQYLFSAYELPKQGLEMMMSMVGKEKMKQMFRQYFNDLQFTHVDPAEVRTSFETACECDLKWFFEGWLYHAHELDYRLKNFDQRLNNVMIENHGTSSEPVSVSGYIDDRRVTQNWVEGFEGEKEIHLDKHVDEVRLFDGIMAPNKNWRQNINPRNYLPTIHLFPKVGSYNRPEIGITPVIGHNLADGYMPGFALTSGLIPQSGLKWFLMPMYGIDSKQLRYYGEGRFTKDLSNKTFDMFLLSASASTFGYNLDTHYVFRDHFFRASLAIALRLNSSSDNSHIKQWLKYRYVDISQHYNRGLNYEEKIYQEEDRRYGVHELKYQISSDVALHPSILSANIQAGEGFVRLNLNYNQHFLGKDKMRGFWTRGFAGWLPVYDQPKAYVPFLFNGLGSSDFYSKDYMYDEWLGGRNANDGTYGRQIFMKDAGLKTLSTEGISEEWMVAGGISAALPFKFIHVYMDATIFPSAISNDITFSYSGGFSVILMKNVFEVYVPLLESKDIRESLSYVVRDRWFERISFQANFKLANPLNIVDRFQLGY